MRILLVPGLAFGLACGQGSSVAAEAAAPAPAKAVDLDFTEDFPAPAKVPIKPPRSRKGGNGQVSSPPPSAAVEPRNSTWYYWALGTLGLAAVAGGAAYYIHWEGEREPAPDRNTQVFTDDPG